MHTVSILVSTRNGNDFIEEQIHSILSQSEDRIRLFIRDDGSTDGTLKKLGMIFNKNKEKVHFERCSQENLGIVKSYNKLLSKSYSEYVCFSDQDDVWIQDKVKISLNRMKELEKRYGRETPILIHTDLKVVDEKLNRIHSSFNKYSRFKPKRSSLNYLLVHNHITGCTMTINKALHKKSFPIPEEALMHDWWIALVASLFGIIDYLENPTVLYRQHKHNFVGARRFGIYYLLSSLLRINKYRSDINNYILQAKTLYNRYQSDITAFQKDQLMNFINIKEKNFIKRKRTILKYRFYKQDILRTIGFFALM